MGIISPSIGVNIKIVSWNHHPVILKKKNCQSICDSERILNFWSSNPEKKSIYYIDIFPSAPNTLLEAV